MNRFYSFMGSVVTVVESGDNAIPEREDETCHAPRRSRKGQTRS